jgi:hypothetical protein
MLVRLVYPTALLAVLVIALAGCGGSKKKTANTSTQPTPDRLKTVVYERALSECASTKLKLLAGKYRVKHHFERNRRLIATRAGASWATYLKAGRDAIRSGRDGCLAGFKMRG